MYLRFPSLSNKGSPSKDPIINLMIFLAVPIQEQMFQPTTSVNSNIESDYSLKNIQNIGHVEETLPDDSSPKIPYLDQDVKMEDKTCKTLDLIIISY